MRTHECFGFECHSIELSPDLPARIELAINAPMSVISFGCSPHDPFINYKENYKTHCSYIQNTDWRNIAKVASTVPKKLKEVEHHRYVDEKFL